MHEHGCQSRRCGAAPFTRAGAEAHYPPDLRIEPVHMALALRVEPEGRRLSGTNTITLAGRGGGGQALRLHAVGFSDVDVAADRALRGWSYDGSAIDVTFDEAIDDGAAASVTIRYTVTDPTSGLYFSAPTADAPDAPRYAATDNETERARHWMPCVDLPAVRPRLDFALRANADLTILANGRHVGDEVHDDGTKTARWSLDAPCPSYLTCFAIGEFVAWHDAPLGDVPIAAYTVTPFEPHHLERSFGRTRDMLAWMQQKLGVPYPFPKYYQFALPGFGGAMENISLVSWDDVFLLDDALATEWSRLVDQVNVHEMAHTWFGDLVVCRDFAHAWLKESWATYMEICWFEDRVGVDERDYELYCAAGRYFGEADRRYVRPVVTRTFNASWQLYDAHLYPGGACRLHSLRSMLGDEVFWRGVRLYLERWRERTVETDDFRRTLEEVSGRALGPFFDQWIHGKGYPQLKATVAWDAVQRQLSFEVTQRQVNTATGVGLFDIDLELAWVIDGEVTTKTVRVHQATHTFVFNAARDPDAVRVDPGMKVLHTLDFNPGDAKLRRQWTDAPDVTGRIIAARELIRTGKAANVDAVSSRYVAEPFWGVRVQVAQAMAESATVRALDALAHCVAVEASPLAMEAVFAAAGGARHVALAEALRLRLDGPLPPRARRAALDALGAQRDAADVPRLLEASTTPGFGDIAAAGALTGLARGRATAALPRLLEATAATAPWRTLPAALGALGVLGRFLDKQDRAVAVEQLVDRLRDPRERVMLAAARALVVMEATEAAGDVSRAARGAAHQHGVTLMQFFDALQDVAQRSAVTRQEEVAVLQERVRKLEDALDKLAGRFDAHVEPRVDASAEQQATDTVAAAGDAQATRKKKRKRG